MNGSCDNYGLVNNTCRTEYGLANMRRIRRL